MTARPTYRTVQQRRAAHNAAALTTGRPARVRRSDLAAFAVTCLIGCAVWAYLGWRGGIWLADHIGWPLTGTAATALVFAVIATAVRSYRRSTHR